MSRSTQANVLTNQAIEEVMKQRRHERFHMVRLVAGEWYVMHANQCKSQGDQHMLDCPFTSQMLTDKYNRLKLEHFSEHMGVFVEIDEQTGYVEPHIQPVHMDELVKRMVTVMHRQVGWVPAAESVATRDAHRLLMHVKQLEWEGIYE